VDVSHSLSEAHVLSHVSWQIPLPFGPTPPELLPTPPSPPVAPAPEHPPNHASAAPSANAPSQIF